MPYIEYAINKDYIEKNLRIEKANPQNSCHGKCYLHEQLDKQKEPADADRNDGGKLIPDKKMDDHLREFLIIPSLYEQGIILSGILDLNLPKKDGREVLAEIKTDEELKHIPTVIMTISQAEEDILKAYNLYANCYITKPIDLDQVINVVKSIEDFWFTIVKLPPKNSTE